MKLFEDQLRLREVICKLIRLRKGRKQIIMVWNFRFKMKWEDRLKNKNEPTLRIKVDPILICL